MNIGKGIKFIRTAAALRQGVMAERLGISQNYLSLLENNKAEPSLALLKKISEEFGVPASFLLWEDAALDEPEDSDVADRHRKLRDLIHELQELRIAKRQSGQFAPQGRPE